MILQESGTTIARIEKISKKSSKVKVRKGLIKASSNMIRNNPFLIVSKKDMTPSKKRISRRYKTSYGEVYMTGFSLLNVYDEIVLEEYLSEREPILLTDDYAPTDILVAPIFR